MIFIADAPLDLRTTIIVVNVVAAVFLLGVGAAAILARRRRAVSAPNLETYHADDAMEGPRLERMQTWALAMGALVAISLPTYWLVEPNRQSAMGDQFLETSIEQGRELFEANDPEENPNGLGCAGCHGADGSGGAAPPQIVPVAVDELQAADGALDSPERVCAPSPDDETQLLCRVTWKAPPLNTVLLRFSREEVHDIIVYGRPGTPMPAWGLEGGGAKGEQSIENLLDFLESIQLDSDEAIAQQADLTDGRLLYQENCARCHTKHWSYIDTFATTKDPDSNTIPYTLFDVLGVPGGGAFGPNLTGDVTLRQFPDVQDHIDFISSGSDFEQPYGTRGVGSGRMPGFGFMLSPKQIEAIVAYERGLQATETKLDDLVIEGGTAGAEPESPTTTTTPAGGAGSPQPAPAEGGGQ